MHKRLGFTIVELMVIVAVIGVLITITTVGYSQWRTTTAENEVKSDLKQASIAMENARNFGSGYPASVPTTFTPSATVQLAYGSGDLRTYCLNGSSRAVASVRFYVRNGGEPTAGSC